MGDAEKKALVRFGRGMVGAVFAVLVDSVAHLSGAAYIVPVVMALGKWVREKTGNDKIPF